MFCCRVSLRRVTHYLLPRTQQLTQLARCRPRLCTNNTSPQAAAMSTSPSTPKWIESITTLPNKSTIASKQWNNHHTPHQPHTPTTYAVCIHGWLDNANSFDPLLNHIAHRLPHIQFVCIDLPGHGKSSHVSRYDIMADAAAIHNFITILLASAGKSATTSTAPTLHLIGHSWGGTVAQLVAAIQPDRVQSIVLLDSLGPFTAEPPELAQAYSTAVINRAVRLSKPKKQYDSVDAVVAHYMHGNKYISKQSTELLMQRGATRLDNGKFIFSHDVALQQWYMSLTEPVYIAFLSRLQCHVTHILAQNEARLRWWMHGEAKAKFLRNFDVRLKTYKSIELIRLDKAEHHAHMDMADVVGEHVITHFSSDLSDRRDSGKHLVAML